MKNPLDSVPLTITLGVIFAIVVMVLIPGSGYNDGGLSRWLHILSGILWIGLLYYFNVVQIPALAAAGADKGGPGGAGISKYIAPRALLWFRWAAVATWLTGAWTARPALHARLHAARTGLADHRHRRLARHDHAVQRLGADLAEPEEGARHRRRHRRGKGQGPQASPRWPRARTSCCRSRCWLCMAGQSHGLPF